MCGRRPQAYAKAEAGIVIMDAGHDAEAALWLGRVGISPDSIIAKPETFCVAAADGRIVVVGSDARGTAYGILELSRMAGVSPWTWWADSRPERRQRLTIDSDFRTLQSPDVRFRGIFINDEDWSIRPWSHRTHVPGSPKGQIAPATYREICRLLLRLRANTLWPSMHEATVPFYCTPGAKETADSCGIIIGTSHCEPLLRNNAGEWDKARLGEYNYFTNRQTILDYWDSRVAETSAFENIYTVGMRGVHDGRMLGAATAAEQAEALENVVADQRALLTRRLGRDAAEVPQIFVPYKEVLAALDHGLRLPDDVTLMWCDDNYGYLTRLSDSTQQRRSGGSGVYYHLSYWGRPHDYLWLCTTQPGLVVSEMRHAYQSDARRLWIANVHDPKMAAADLELFLDLAWDIDAATPATLPQYIQSRLTREFGPDAAQRLMPAMHLYFRLCGMRKPEHMGWSQVELDKRVYHRGLSPVSDSELSLSEFGGELDTYLADYAKADSIVDAVAATVPERQREAYFIMVRYPVACAAAMSVKTLEAQRARTLAEMSADETDIRAACARSIAAHRRIIALTDHYNNRLSDGKWRHSVSAAPRQLPVFEAPTLPRQLTDAEVDTLSRRPARAIGLSPSGAWCTARNAADHTSATDGVQPVYALGHSMKAVQIPKGGSLTFEFESETEGEMVLRAAFVPTQPDDRGDLRYSVSIDGETPQTVSLREPFRSEPWKTAVLRGQMVRQTRHSIGKGRHSLTISALDSHIVLDQWMLDAAADRRFYLFPVGD